MRVSSSIEDKPVRSPWLFRVFRWYATRYVARHFHAVRISRRGPLPVLPGCPVVVVLNHPSWWDPLIATVVTASLPAARRHHAPIEAAGLAQYPFLERLGFIGFESDTTAGARLFLRKSLAILGRRDSILWITAQGQFADPRRRPTLLRPGVGHLARRLDGAVVIPMAIEYPFWDDRCPEVLLRFGTAIEIEAGRARSSRKWTALFERSLESVLDALAIESQDRDPGAFTTLLGGTAGVGGVYDLWRRTRAGSKARPSVPSMRPVSPY